MDEPPDVSDPEVVEAILRDPQVRRFFADWWQEEDILRRVFPPRRVDDRETET